MSRYNIRNMLDICYNIWRGRVWEEERQSWTLYWTVHALPLHCLSPRTSHSLIRIRGPLPSHTLSFLAFLRALLFDSRRSSSSLLPAAFSSSLSLSLSRSLSLCRRLRDFFFFDLLQVEWLGPLLELVNPGIRDHYWRVVCDWTQRLDKALLLGSPRLAA